MCIFDRGIMGPGDPPKGMKNAKDLSFVSGHGFSRVPMSLRLSQGDENHPGDPSREGCEMERNGRIA